MDPILLSTVFIFGACIGSFLNVCIYRIPREQSIIFPGSSCPSCKTAIPPYFNIPLISYVVLKGRCRSCNKPISLRYPGIELLTAISALALVLKFGFTSSAAFWFVFICVLIVISFIDIDLQIIPDIISLPGIILFLSSCLFVPEITFKAALIGIFAGGGILYSVAVLYYLIRKEEGMGGGDIKLLAMIGAAIGWKGVLFTLFTGSLFGTLAGLVIMMVTRILNVRLKIPFGPYLSAGAVLYIFYGNQLIQWYFNLLR